MGRKGFYVALVLLLFPTLCFAGFRTDELNVTNNATVNNSLGVGTAPAARLHVRYPTTGNVIFEAETGDGSSNLNINFGYNGYGYYWRYYGAGSGDGNQLQLWTEGAGSTDDPVYAINQSGNITFNQSITVQGLIIGNGSQLTSVPQWQARYNNSDAATITINWSLGNVQSVVLGGNRNIEFTDGQDGARYTLMLVQDDTGSRTVTWNATTMRFADNTTPTLTTTANKTDYFAILYNGLSSTYDFIGQRLNF